MSRRSQDPFDAFFGGNPFAMMRGGGSSMMDDMFGNMSQMAQQGGGTSYSFSSVSSYSSNGGNVVTQSKTTRAGPGGVVETQESFKDSARGIEKMGVRRQIGDKSRTVMRTRHGDNEETLDETENINHGEEAMFDSQWSNATRALPQSRSHGGLLTNVPSSHHSRDSQRHLEYGGDSRGQHTHAGSGSRYHHDGVHASRYGSSHRDSRGSHPNGNHYDTASHSSSHSGERHHRKWHW